MMHKNTMRSFQEMLDENRQSFGVKDMESIGKSGVGDNEYTRHIKAKIIGMRAKQISYGAPCLAKNIPNGMLDPIDLALLEWEQGVCPIEVNPTYTRTKGVRNPDTGRMGIITEELPDITRERTDLQKVWDRRLGRTGAQPPAGGQGAGAPADAAGGAKDILADAKVIPGGTKGKKKGGRKKGKKQPEPQPEQKVEPSVDDQIKAIMRKYGME